MFFLADALLFSLLPTMTPLGILTGLADIIGFVILFVIGILLIILVVGALIVLLPAIIVAIIVWFLTGSFFYAGIAFLVVALISLIVV
jgi:hypothetical protein